MEYNLEIPCELAISKRTHEYVKAVLETRDHQNSEYVLNQYKQFTDVIFIYVRMLGFTCSPILILTGI